MVKINSDAEFREAIEQFIKRSVPNKLWDVLVDFLLDVSIHEPYSNEDILFGASWAKRLIKLFPEVK